MIKPGDLGVDVSEYQGTVDWQSFKEANTHKFAICKASEYRLDKQFVRNWQQLRELDIQRGNYFFAHFNEFTAAESAQHFIESVEFTSDGWQPKDLGPILDLESGDGPLADQSWEFLDRMAQATGLLPIVYSRVNFLMEHWYERLPDGSYRLLNEYLKQYPLWLARYSYTQPVAPDGFKCIIWQRSDNATVSGINGSVDENICLEDYGMDIAKLNDALNSQWALKQQLESGKLTKKQQQLASVTLFDDIVKIKEATGLQ